MGLNSSPDNDENAKKVQHIFMVCNYKTIAFLPCGCGLRFQLILSRRSVLDESVAYLVRPLFDNGLRVEAFCKLLKKLHTK